MHSETGGVGFGELDGILEGVVSLRVAVQELERGCALRMGIITWERLRCELCELLRAEWYCHSIGVSKEEVGTSR